MDTDFREQSEAPGERQTGQQSASVHRDLTSGKAGGTQTGLRAEHLSVGSVAEGQEERPGMTVTSLLGSPGAVAQLGRLCGEGVAGAEMEPLLSVPG